MCFLTLGQRLALALELKGMGNPLENLFVYTLEVIFFE